MICPHCKQEIPEKCVECGDLLDPLEEFLYEDKKVCRDCFIKLIPREGREMFLNPSGEGGIPWEEMG